jgi:hypothetical protein
VTKAILLAGGDTVSEHFTQSNLSNYSTFNLPGSGGAEVRDCLVMGSTLWFTRSRHEVQQDATDAQQVYVGNLDLECGDGGALSVRGTRTHNMARTALQTTAFEDELTIDSRDFCANGIWSDAMVVSQGIITDWQGDRLFMGPYTSKGLGFVQSERAIQISTDAGENFSDLPTDFDPKDMPHGFLGEHIGTWDFDTETFTAAPDPAKSMRVRYWYNLDGGTDKPGFQYWANRMELATHDRWPASGDVFRIKDGDTWIDVTFQSGRWTNASTYVPDSGGNPAATGPVSEDAVQINRRNVTIQQASFVDSVFFGVKGAFFLTGTAGFPSDGSTMTNIAVERHFNLTSQTGAYRSDWSRLTSDNTLKDALFIQTQNRVAFNDGTRLTLSIGAAGENNTVTALGRVTILTAGTGLNFSDDATLVNPGNVHIVPLKPVSNFDQFGPLPEGSTAPLYFLDGNYDEATGRPIMPAYPQVFDYRVPDYVVTTEGWDVNATIAACIGDHERWNDVIDEMKAVYHKEPETVAVVENDAAVGTVIATGVSPAFHATEGGNGEGYFEIVGGQLRVAKSLAGVDRVFPLRGSDDRLMILDVVTA